LPKNERKIYLIERALRDVKKVLLEQLVFAVENVKKFGGKRGFWMNMQEI